MHLPHTQASVGSSLTSRLVGVMQSHPMFLPNHPSLISIIFEAELLNIVKFVQGYHCSLATMTVLWLCKRYLQKSLTSGQVGGIPVTSGRRELDAHASIALVLLGSCWGVLGARALISVLLVARSRTTKGGFPKSSLGSSSLQSRIRHNHRQCCLLWPAPKPAA